VTSVDSVLNHTLSHDVCSQQAPLKTLFKGHLTNQGWVSAGRNLFRFLPCQWFKPAKTWFKLAKTWS